MWRWRMFLQHSNAKTVTAHNLTDKKKCGQFCPHFLYLMHFAYFLKYLL